jgi:DnaJ-domain-containing protein 1
LRACHLLQLKNVDILNDEKATNVDIATLQEVLDLQEKIFEISQEEEIRNLQNQLNLKIRLLLADFVKHFEASEIKEATQILIKVKYLKKSLQDLKIRKQKI